MNEYNCSRENISQESLILIKANILKSNIEQSIKQDRSKLYSFIGNRRIYITSEKDNIITFYSKNKLSQMIYLINGKEDNISLIEIFNSKIPMLFSSYTYNNTRIKDLNSKISYSDKDELNYQHRLIFQNNFGEGKPDLKKIYGISSQKGIKYESNEFLSLDFFAINKFLDIMIQRIG